jgi:hypothetical protein
MRRPRAGQRSAGDMRRVRGSRFSTTPAITGSYHAVSRLYLIRIAGHALASAILFNMAATPAGAAPVTYAQWTFEQSRPASPGPHAPEEGSGSAFVVHNGSSESSSAVGNGSEHSFSSTGWRVGDYFQFNFIRPNVPNHMGNTTLIVEFDMASNGVQPPSFVFQVSRNGGPFSMGSEQNPPSDAPPNAAWNSSTRQARYQFRRGSGSSFSDSYSYRFLCDDVPFPLDLNMDVRFDNVHVYSVPEPASGLLAACAAVVGFACRRRV